MLAQFSMKKKDKKLPGILAEVVPHAASMPLVALLSSSTQCTHSCNYLAIEH